MQNRFNRPFGPEHVEALIHKLREAAMARQESDALAADVMFKSLHMITNLWHECSLHDNLAKQAELVLEATERSCETLWKSNRSPKLPWHWPKSSG